MITNITEIKAKSNIIEVIEQFLPLKKAGANYQANCPFHNEKSASFIVSPTKQIYTCFGCGKSGDVFSFVQEYKHLSFEESVCEVAELCNIEPLFEKGSRTQKIDKKSLYNKYESLCALAQKELQKQPKVLQYLFNRGLTQEDLEYFNIGYTPSKEQILSLFSQEEALNLGLLKKSTYKESFCPFKERIIFALYNHTHHIVGLSGRTHPYANFKNAPKYYNSSESFLFKKSEYPYLYSFAKSHIKNTKEAIICEGYLDAITLHKLGFKNTIATCGIAFNLNTINAIYKLENEVNFTLFFDNDEAGRAACIRAIELLLKHKIYTIFCLLLDKDHKDINELYTKRLLSQSPSETQKELKNYIKKERGLRFYIYYHFKNAKSPKDKDRLLLWLKDLVAQEHNFYQKQALIDELSSITHIEQAFFTSTSTPHIILKENRFYPIVYAIYNHKECAFIAKESDLSFLPKELLSDVRTFLDTNQIPQNALKIALNENYNLYNFESFYKELLSLQIHQAKTQMIKAKTNKDISHICALQSFIQEKHKELDILAKPQEEIF